MSVDESGDGVTITALAQELHDTGFVALTDKHSSHLKPRDALVTRVREAVLRLHEAHLRTAREKQIDLTLLKNAEVLAGFYVRQGGRVDMQVSAMTFQKAAVHVLAAADASGGERDASTKTTEAPTIDTAPFQEMACCWQSLVKEIFNTDVGDKAGEDSSRVNYRLEYVGCVVSRPGDEDQNWHLDGVHRNLTQHEKADRLNVFVPLVDLSESVGGTEMKKTSHIRGDGSAFEHYAHLESVTHLVSAGTPVIMDYRVWHRGLANSSTSDTIRPLLYFKYVKIQPPDADTNGKRKTTEAAAADNSKKKKKRISLTQVTK